MDATGKVLIRAAELIAERGWRCGGSNGLGLSMWSAIYDAGYMKHAASVFDLLDQMIGGQTRLFTYRPWAAWEKQSDRTTEEVIDTLIAAAYWR